MENSTFLGCQTRLSLFQQVQEMRINNLRDPSKPCLTVNYIFSEKGREQPFNTNTFTSKHANRLFEKARGKQPARPDDCDTAVPSPSLTSLPQLQQEDSIPPPQNAPPPPPLQPQRPTPPPSRLSQELKLPNIATYSAALSSYLSQKMKRLRRAATSRWDIGNYCISEGRAHSASLPSSNPSQKWDIYHDLRNPGCGIGNYCTSESFYTVAHADPWDDYFRSLPTGQKSQKSIEAEDYFSHKPKDSHTAPPLNVLVSLHCYILQETRPHFSTKFCPKEKIDFELEIKRRKFDDRLVNLENPRFEKFRWNTVIETTTGPLNPPDWRIWLPLRKKGEVVELPMIWEDIEGEEEEERRQQWKEQQKALPRPQSSRSGYSRGGPFGPQRVACTKALPTRGGYGGPHFQTSGIRPMMNGAASPSGYKPAMPLPKSAYTNGLIDPQQVKDFEAYQARRLKVDHERLQREEKERKEKEGREGREGREMDRVATAWLGSQPERWWPYLVEEEEEVERQGIFRKLSTLLKRKKKEKVCEGSASPYSSNGSRKPSKLRPRLIRNFSSLSSFLRRNKSNNSSPARGTGTATPATTTCGTSSDSSSDVKGKGRLMDTSQVF